MNFELFLAKKIIKGGKNSFSKPIIRISIVAITLGITMMTLSLSIVQGFQAEIEKKVIGFGSHIQISTYESIGLLENKPISKNREFVDSLKKIKGINHIQIFANKGAILKTEENNYMVVIKGIGQDYEWTFFNQYIKEGKIPQLDSNKKTNEILISSIISDKLQLHVGDDVLAYFIQQPPRIRKFTVSGIYNTGLGEMDEKMILGDIRQIQKLNGWEDHQIGGFEILIDDLDKIKELDEKIYEIIDYDLTSTSIIDARPELFNWLALMDTNVIVIISLLILVCGIDIISALLILILERTSMIGILKALGAKNASIRKVFIYNAAHLILYGLFFGNLFGIGISLLQLEYGFIGLPQEAYFIDKVPIQIDFLNLVLLNIGTLLCCLLMLIIPSNIIAKISPIKAIRFD
ncbi:MAG: ABC transporter permease [Flavobacteriales bacterium]|nr:ABC transporter permease [Flavobacteriales bacterium]